MKLTNREREVCEYLIEGLSNNEVAEELFLSKHTVKLYVSQSIAKAMAKNRTQLAYILGKKNII